MGGEGGKIHGIAVKNKKKYNYMINNDLQIDLEFTGSELTDYTGTLTFCGVGMVFVIRH